MPNRLIREGLIDSEAVLLLPVEGRWLYLTIMLCADDLGLFEATEFKLARRADIKRETAGKLMTMLADADLIRLYQVENKTYGFIPKFQQRLQIKRAKHPLPPVGIFTDDVDALNKINNLALNPRLANGYPRLSTVVQPSEPEPEPEQEKKKYSTSPAKLPTCPTQDLIDIYHEVLPRLPKCKLLPKKRADALRRTWAWVLTSTKPDKTRRAETADQAVGWFREYFSRAQENDFLMGKTPRSAEHAGWKCDLDYLLTDSGMKQVIEKTGVTA